MPTATTPKLSEKAVTSQIIDWLAARGWHAERNQVGFFHGRMSVGVRGKADWSLTKRIEPGQCWIFHLEVKGANARTELKRAATQQAWAKTAERLGQPVCIIPDRTDDPLAYFQTWYLCHFGAASL